MSNKEPFKFEISLSILNHLGKNLYRNFATVLGEAISNSWDADAKKVEIYIDRNKDSFIIKDDGEGMTHDDFQNKFLRVGYSKRNGGNKSEKGRHYIGRKGIGKLALLSCADRIHIISKKENGEYTGGVIDNSNLDDAIKGDSDASDYLLEEIDHSIFGEHLENHEKGTIIYFENVKRGIKNNEEFLRKIVALSFRFSLLDESFRISINDQEVTLDDINDLAQNTQFLWRFNETDDPYIKEKLTNLKKPEKNIEMMKEEGITGFIASVKKPGDLNVWSTGEKVGIELFVNGRLRERNILKHIPTTQLAGVYLYGQIHFNDLDDDEDRFTSSREGIVPDDQKFAKLLKNLSKEISSIVSDWDKWRLKIKEEGDPENTEISKQERHSKGLYNIVSERYTSSSNEEVEKWVDDLEEDAKFNLFSYIECFVSENLIRKYVQKKNIDITEVQPVIDGWKEKERQDRESGNIRIDIRKNPHDTSYLSINNLADLVDRSQGQDRISGLSRDAMEYNPIRAALMHTALLTDEAKDKLTTIRNNIEARIKNILSENEE